MVDTRRSGAFRPQDGALTLHPFAGFKNLFLSDGTTTLLRGGWGQPAVMTPDFVPTDISWVALGWASDPLETPHTNGTAISSWRDASGGGFTFNQGTGAKQPVYRSAAATLKNQPAWDCDGTEGLGSNTYTSVGPCSLVTIAYVDPTQPNATGWLVSGYDTNVRLTNAGKVVINSWGSTSDTATDNIDHRGEVIFVAVYFNGAATKWVISGPAGTRMGFVNLSAGNNFSTRLTAASWDGNVNSTDTVKAKYGLVGTYNGDLTSHALFADMLTWFRYVYL